MSTIPNLPPAEIREIKKDESQHKSPFVSYLEYCHELDPKPLNCELLDELFKKNKFEQTIETSTTVTTSGVTSTTTVPFNSPSPSPGPDKF